MNRYQSMMEQVPIPAGQAERLRAAVLAAEPEGRGRIYRPRSFGKKVLLAALVAAALTATVGAAVAGIDWSWIFTEQFGEDAAATDMAAELFQEVGVTSVCDDVTLTVRETVGDDHTIYMILDYELPDTVDREELVKRWREVDTLNTWGIDYVPTDAVTWEDIRGQTFPEAQKSVKRSVEMGRRWTGASFGGGCRGYDPETNTLTWLMRVTPSLPASLTERPLTVMLDALVLGGEPLTDHPAIVTFQPVNNARTVSGACEDGETGVSFQVVLSPLALLINARGERYEEFGNGAIYEVLTLVYTDGSAVPVVELASNGGAGHGGDMDGVPRSSTTMRFDELLDITDVRAVRIDGVEIPLS